MKWVLIVVGVIVLLVAVVVVVGLTVPRSHVAASRITIKQRPEKLWKVITDFEKWPAWNRDVKKMVRGPDQNGNPVWVMHSRHGPMPSEIVEETAPSKLVTRVADPNLPFGGAWTWEVAYVGNGVSTVTITEDGQIYNPIFRAMARYVFGYHATQQSFLKALSKHFGEESLPVVVK